MGHPLSNLCLASRGIALLDRTPRESPDGDASLSCRHAMTGILAARGEVGCIRGPSRSARLEIPKRELMEKP